MLVLIYLFEQGGCQKNIRKLKSTEEPDFEFLESLRFKAKFIYRRKLIRCQSFAAGLTCPSGTALRVHCTTVGVGVGLPQKCPHSFKIRRKMKLKIKEF